MKVPNIRIFVPLTQDGKVADTYPTILAFHAPVQYKRKFRLIANYDEENTVHTSLPGMDEFEYSQYTRDKLYNVAASTLANTIYDLYNGTDLYSTVLPIIRFLESLPEKVEVMLYVNDFREAV